MTIYLDMDGVFADFPKRLDDLKIPHNLQWGTPRETWTKETWEGEEIKVKAMHTPGFWLGIPPLVGCRMIYDVVQHLDPFFLTAKPREDSPTALIHKEKLAWVKDYLDPYFSPVRMIVCDIGGKGPYCKQPGDILVDDDARANGKAWQEAGGTFIHHTSVPTTLTKLYEVLYA